MIHKSLAKLRDRIIKAQNQNQLDEIEADCDWTNCALGTRLREFGIEIRKRNSEGYMTNSYEIVKSMVVPELLERGTNFNMYLATGRKEAALKFIEDLRVSSLDEILRN